MAGALVLGLTVVEVDGALFVGVDVDAEFGGGVGLAFEAADFGVEFLFGVGGLLEEDALLGLGLEFGVCEMWIDREV